MHNILLLGLGGYKISEFLVLFCSYQNFIYHDVLFEILLKAGKVKVEYCLQKKVSEKGS